MVTRQREPETWFGRVANEVYLGALVVGAVVLLAGIAAGLIAVVMEVNNWVMMVD
jgi:hypothetical protein